MSDLHRLLKTHFGYDTFRPLQEEVMRRVLENRDGLVVMPTGGGKSLCYQLPALRFDGLTLVISPLIALMKDQVDALKENGIPAAFVNSTLMYGEVGDILSDVRENRLKILYVAPERLAIAHFRDFLRARKVSLIAVDEAHCISEWGHDFRPDYRNLKTLRDDFPQTPILALTATATERVRKDILEQLALRDPKVFLASFNRENLIYRVRPKKNAFAQLVALLRQKSRVPAIVYCFSRKDAEGIAEDLRNGGLNALAYHAGMDAELRHMTQDRFRRDEVPIITATIAFGMGIDKPDVRTVVHYDLPKSVEGYYQETGRAGRDGLPSECVLFYSYGDRMKQEFFINQMEDDGERRRAAEQLRHMLRYGDLPGCRRRYLLGYFGERWDAQNCDACDNCLATRDDFDATVIAQKILSAVIRTGERYGIQYVLHVLLGAKRKEVLEREHDKLSVFGIVEDFSEADIRRIAGQLTERGLLAKVGDDYPILRLTEEGRRWLKARESIRLPKLPAAETPRKSKSVRGVGGEYDEELFEKLRELRKTLADERKVPPYVIFGDKTLIELATDKPTNAAGFERIHGVGRQKLSEFSDDFLAVIREVVGEDAGRLPWTRPSSRDRLVKRSDSTYAETKTLLEKGWTLEEIAEQRGFTVNTALRHLEKLTDAGIAPDIEHLRPPPERLERIRVAFEQSDTRFLAPVMQILGDGTTYEELRLARLFLWDRLVPDDSEGEE